MTDLGQDPASVADPDSAADGEALLNRMHRTLWRYAALCGLVNVGCPQQLRDGPLTVTELAQRCGAHAPTLTRVLRTAVTTVCCARPVPTGMNSPRRARRCLTAWNCSA